MVFAAPVFLILFLPIVLLGSVFLRGRVRNFWIFALSVVFYAWGGVEYAVLLLLSTVVNFLLGFLVDEHTVKGQGWRRFFCVVAVIYNLSFLVYFKYAGFLLRNVSTMLGWFGKSGMIEIPQITLPIGISFFTFQILSYVVDVYRKEVPVQRNIINLGMYIFLFPQLIAGPIVRYADVRKEIENPSLSAENFRAGFLRFVLGLSKKVLISNSLASIADQAFAAVQEIGIVDAWVGIIAYALHIYFDFSAYSDMAIGLGRCMGFTFQENFNYPYISTSIKEFWRRWHISLSTWFRDYVYIPLGGNRRGSFKTYRNLMIVFLLTGVWHGAEWTYILWGVFHGVFLLIERMGFGKWLERRNVIVRWMYTMLVVLLGWVFFRAESLASALAYIAKMFDVRNANGITLLTLTHMQQFSMVFGVIFSAPLLRWLKEKSEKWFAKGKLCAPLLMVVQDAAMLFLLVLSLSFLAGTGYNPFIYFKF